LGGAVKDRKDGSSAEARGFAATVAARRMRVFLLRRFVRWVPSERQRLFTLTIVSGVLCGLAAVAFHVGIEKAATILLDRPVAGVSPLLLLVIPTLGGVACGILLRHFPEARGSGVPQVKAAYAVGPPAIPLRTSVAKFGIGILQIGTGSSLGREGPTVQICAGISSSLAQGAALSQQGVRRMLPVGAAAGIAAAFNAPIAAVTFAVEEIVGDLDQAVLSGVIVAAALAAVIERAILGQHPVFQIAQTYELQSAASLLLYVLLGIAAALVSVAFTDSLLNLRLSFRKLSAVPDWAKPGIGGFVTGALALIALLVFRLDGVTGGGYQTLSDALSGRVALQALLVLLVLKFVATVFSYSSGGAGGIFAPALFLGGMLGGAFGYLDRFLLGTEAEHLGAFALVGMGAVFAGIIRAPITSVLIIFEMTNGYSLILPLMIANMSAYALARRWRPTPVYVALLQQDGVTLPRRGAGNPLDRIPVSAVMTVEAVKLSPSMTLREALEVVSIHDYNLYPVVDREGRFAGFASAPLLRRAAAQGMGESLVAEHIAYENAVSADTAVAKAAVRLRDSGHHLLAVVGQDPGGKFLGMITSSDIVKAQAALASPGGTAPGTGSKPSGR
jgi:chloride channel protein, CIC family